MLPHLAELGELYEQASTPMDWLPCFENRKRVKKVAVGIGVGIGIGVESSYEKMPIAIPIATPIPIPTATPARAKRSDCFFSCPWVRPRRVKNCRKLEASYAGNRGLPLSAVIILSI